MDYVQEMQLPMHIVSDIRQQLQKTRVRKQYRRGCVYRPTIAKLSLTNKQTILKATFYNQKLVQCVQKFMPDTIEMLPDEHIDLLRYSHDQYLEEHTDDVHTHTSFPYRAHQVTVLIGLLDAKQGGTVLRVHNQKKEYMCSARKGGVLMFNSLISHTEQRVVGHKEVLVLSAYLFPRRISRAHWHNVYCDRLDCIAVYRTKYDLNNTAFHSDYNEDDTQPLYEEPTYYFYQNHKWIGVYSPYYHICECIQQQPDTPPIQLQNEQLKLLKQYPHLGIGDVHTHHYPLLECLMQETCIKECFEQSHSTHSVFNTIYDDFCNSEYEHKIRTDAIMRIQTSTKCFGIAIYNARYYHFWLCKIFNGNLPTPAQRCIVEYTVW